jgi:hypothetical protein
MGPDLLGIVGATVFMLAVIGVFAVVDRIVCGAWDALLGSPGPGLVAGMTAWSRTVVRELPRSPSS